MFTVRLVDASGAVLGKTADRPRRPIQTIGLAIKTARMMLKSYRLTYAYHDPICVEILRDHTVVRLWHNKEQ